MGSQRVRRRSCLVFPAHPRQVHHSLRTQHEAFGIERTLRSHGGHSEQRKDGIASIRFSHQRRATHFDGSSGYDKILSQNTQAHVAVSTRRIRASAAPFATKRTGFVNVL